MGGDLRCGEDRGECRGGDDVCQGGIELFGDDDIETLQELVLEDAEVDSCNPFKL